MTWKHEMHKRAVEIAFQQWGWRDDDVVSIVIDGGERGFNTSETFDPGLDASIIVNVYRADEKQFLINGTTVCQKVYSGDGINYFWNRLMNGS